MFFTTGKPYKILPQTAKLAKKQQNNSILCILDAYNISARR